MLTSKFFFLPFRTALDRTIENVFPIIPPLLPPRKRPATHGADFLGQVRFICISHGAFFLVTAFPVNMLKELVPGFDQRCFFQRYL